MRPEVRKLVFDVHQAATGVSLMLEGKSEADFIADRVLQLATERQFEIIGEALSRLRKIAPDALTDFPEHTAIIGLRNIIAHGYDQVDHRRLFDIARTHVPILATSAEAVLLRPPGGV